jgi:hypothetical protein
MTREERSTYWHNISDGGCDICYFVQPFADLKTRSSTSAILEVKSDRYTLCLCGFDNGFVILLKIFLKFWYDGGSSVHLHQTFRKYFFGNLIESH